MLADTNGNRDWRIFSDFAQSLMRMARPLHADDPLGMELDHAPYALDATMIDFGLSLFPWTRFQRSTATFKVNTLLNLRGNIPKFLHISEGTRHEVKVLDEIVPEAGPST